VTARRVAAFMMEAVYLHYGLGTYAVLLGSWLAACAPFFLLDRLHLVERYRIQRTPDGKRVPAACDPRVKAEAKRLVLTNWTWLLPAVLAAAPVLKRLFPADAAPPAWQFVLPIALLWFVLHDCSFYCYHRTLHEVPWLYRRFHKPHHRLTAPFAWGSHAVHPVEMALQSLGAMSGPLLWSIVFGLPVHAWWLWLALIQIQGVMDHSGYALPLPFDVFAMLPGFGGTRFHDEHHQYFNGNYAAALSVIDDVMGTRLKPKRHGE